MRPATSANARQRIGHRGTGACYRDSRSTLVSDRRSSVALRRRTRATLIAAMATLAVALLIAIGGYIVATNTERGRARANVSSEASSHVEVKQEKTGLFGARKKKAEVRSDVELIQAFQAGDERAYAELYVRRKSEVYTFCLRMLGGDADAASDAFQEVS